MRDFRKIQEILGSLPNIKKIYLLGSTGAGKTSLVRKIIGTSQYNFPTVTQRRTTVVPTEYVIDSTLDFKTTIILKKRQDIEDSITELIEMAIIKILKGGLEIEDVVFELEQTPDERFKLKQIISPEMLREKAEFILSHIIPRIKDMDEEAIFSESYIKDEIKKITLDFIEEIEARFNEKCNNSHQLFSDEPYIINNITDKGVFINQNKDLLANQDGSISILVEYVRIEGDLLADWVGEDLKFVIIDGEGIGHSLGEKRHTLSIRHYDYFNLCNEIVLIENSDNPFITGGQEAIESIFLNGYSKKFKLAFSKIDKLNISDTNSYFRRNIRNLSSALKEKDIDFDTENKDTYKLAKLNKNSTSEVEKEIKKILLNINDSTESSKVSLEYDFNNLLINLDRDKFISEFQKDINFEHWAVIKAFSKRMFNEEVEYRHIKPISWMLRFIMQDVNSFLRREDDLQSDILDSQNKIKQNFSKKIISFIYDKFIKDNNYLWQQAYEKSGIGSDRERKDFIFNQTLMVFLPSKQDEDIFNAFRNEIKNLLLESGAKELKSAVKISLASVDIKKIYGKINFKWNLGDNVNIILGKNGSGKSTVIKLIDACINNKKEVFEQYGFPYVELTLLKEYKNGDKQEIKISNNKLSSDIHSILISTFDVSMLHSNEGKTSLDLQLSQLIDEFGKYQRSLTQIIAKKTESETKESKEIRNNIVSANPKQLGQYQQLIIQIDEVRKKITKPINDFKEILDLYLKYTNKTVIVDDEKAPLLIKFKNENSEQIINTTQLSSGEKQLLIIFLTVILQKDKPFILLMDEPETSLHVEWQSTLIDNIRKVKSNIQVITATHNPLMALNRSSNEIGVIRPTKEEIETDGLGSEYLDISSILLKYFELPSLIGKVMQKDIKDITRLKLKRQEELTAEESSELERLSLTLENSFAGEIIYDKKYFSFLKFLKENKGIDIDTIEEIDESEFHSFLEEFGGEFDD